MSEVERVDISDDTAVVQNDFTPNELLTEDMSKIMESYVNTAFNIALGQEFQICEAQESQDPEKSLKSSEQSGYSFLTEAFSGDVGKDVAFYVENECVGNEAKVVEIIEDMMEKAPSKITEVFDSRNILKRSNWLEQIYIKNFVLQVTDSRNEGKEKEDVARYENAYLTLNRK